MDPGILAAELTPAPLPLALSESAQSTQEAAKGEEQAQRLPKAKPYSPHSPLSPHLLLRAKGFCLSAVPIFGCRKKVAAIHTWMIMRPRTMDMVRLKHRVKLS